MQLNRCPVCHSRIGLEQLAQDEAGRELLALLAKLDTHTGTALLGYLGLFRPAHRDLANDRALRLAQEAITLEAPQWLAPALAETTEAIKQKRTAGETKPLANHNYLKQVLASVVSRGTNAPAIVGQAAPAVGYATNAGSLSRLTDTSWAKS